MINLLKKIKLSLKLRKAINKLNEPEWYVKWEKKVNDIEATIEIIIYADSYRKAYKKAMRLLLGNGKYKGYEITSISAV